MENSHWIDPSSKERQPSHSFHYHPESPFDEEAFTSLASNTASSLASNSTFLSSCGQGVNIASSLPPTTKSTGQGPPRDSWDYCNDLNMDAARFAVTFTEDANVVSSQLPTTKSTGQDPPPENWHYSNMDAGRVAVTFTEDLMALGRRHVHFVDELEKNGSYVDECDTANGSMFSKLRGSCEDEDWSTNETGISHKGRPSRSSFGLTCLHEPGTARLLEDDQSHAAEEKSIQKTGTVNLEQQWQENCVAKLVCATNAPCHVTSAFSQNVNFRTDDELGSQEMAYKYLEPRSAGIVVSVHSSSVKGRLPFTTGHLAASKNTTDVTGWEGGTTDCTELMVAQASAFSTLNSEEKDNCKRSVSETSVPLGVESSGEELLVDDVQNVENCKESKSDVDPYAGEMCSNNSMLSKGVPHPNGCQSLISSIHNLSKVLLTSEYTKCGYGSGHIDVDALENSIHILSDCLLKRSSDNLAKTSQEPTVKSQENFQDQLQGENVDVQHANEANFSTVPEDQGCLQKCPISSFLFTKHSASGPDQRVSSSVETVPSACAVPNIVWERDRRGAGGTKNYAEEAESFSIKKFLEEPLKELLELQDKLLKLQEDIAQERSENNITASIYKSLWREAQNELHSCRSDIIKTSSELECLKQMLSKQKYPGVSDMIDHKDLDGSSLDHERGMQGFDHEGLWKNSLDFTLLSVHNMQQQRLSHTQSESEDDLEFHGSWGQGLPKSEEVLTAYFGPVKSVSVDSEGADAFSDTKEVVSRFSILQTAHYKTSDKGETTSNFLSNSSLDSPVDIDTDLGQHLPLCLGRQAFDLNSSCNDNASVDGFSEQSSELATDVLRRQESNSHVISDSVPDFRVPLQSEAPSAESVQEQGFENMDSKCSLELNSISDKVKEDVLSDGSWDRQAHVEEGCASVAQVDSGIVTHPSLNAEEHWKDEASLVDEKETKVTWDTQQQGETEIICLRPGKTDSHKNFLAEAEWEHVVVSWV